MSVPALQNYSLLKQQITQAQQTIYNKQQLKQQLKQKQLIVTDLSKKIEIKRQQMKNLSKGVNALIEKQQKKPSKERPSFHPHFSKNRLNQLKQQKESIYKEIQKLKDEIKNIKDDQSQGIVKEILACQAKLSNLQKQILKVKDNKQILKDQLEANKNVLDHLKQNACLVDLELKQKEYNQIKRQCKLQEKNINILTAEELQRTNYYLDIKEKFQKEKIENKIQQVDQTEVKNMILQIKQIYEERNKVEKEQTAKIKEFQKIISDLEKQIKQKHCNIRQLQNQILRNTIESKRLIIMKEQYSTNKSSFRENKPQIKEKPKENPQIKYQKRIGNKIYLTQYDDGNCITLGQWSTYQKTMSDRIQNWFSGVERVKYITFYLLNNSIVGLKSTYINGNNLLQEGKQLIMIDHPSLTELQVHLEDVTNIYYSSKLANVYLNFLMNNQTVKQIGNREGNDCNQMINLATDLIKNIQAQFNDSNQIIGLRINLTSKHIEEKIIVQEMPEQTVKTITQRSFSNGDLIKKRVFVKGRSLKKIRQQPLIDHRLMLHKNKLV